MLNFYNFFFALAVALVTLLIQFTFLQAGEKKARTLVFIFCALGTGLLSAQLWGGLGSYVATGHWDYASISVVGFVVCLGPMAVYWGRRNKKLGDKLLGRLAWGLPLAQALGRLGCFFAECCYGVWTRLSWPLTEGSLLVALAFIFYVNRARAPGSLHFRRYLATYALLRISLDFFRADALRGVWSLSLHNRVLNISLAQLSLAALLLWLFLDWKYKADCNTTP